MKIFYVLFIFITINSLESKKFILPLLGNQRSGRSCFINNFLNIVGDKIPKIGEDDGEITTLDIDLYDGSNYYFHDLQFTLIDTKGFENSLENDFTTVYSTFQDIYNYNSKINKIDALLFFYSLNRDAITLERDLKILKLILGDEALHNLVIIFTKRSNKKHSFLNLEKIAETHKLRFLYLDSKCEEKVEQSFIHKLKKHLYEIRENQNKFNSHLSLENIKSTLSELEAVALVEHKNYEKSKKSENTPNSHSNLEIVVDYLTDQFKSTLNNNLHKQQEDLVNQQQWFSLIPTLAFGILPLAFFLFKKRSEIRTIFEGVLGRTVEVTKIQYKKFCKLLSNLKMRVAIIPKKEELLTNLKTESNELTIK